MNRRSGLLAGRYRLHDRIGTGGMGEVWRADDTVLNRPVAVKVVKPEYGDDPQYRWRLRAEARAAASVHHPRVVHIYDVGEAQAEDGGVDAYIVMELLPGRSLADILAERPLTPEECTVVLRDVAEALTVAHSQGVVHRDIKPANLMVGPDGHITVMDFGIARAADHASLTATGVMLGTARYISPEQVSGQAAIAASDIYALGVVAYYCLAGRPPFDAGSDVATALAHREDPPPPLPALLPPALVALVMSCLAKRPQDRPTAAQLAAAAQAPDLLAAMPPVPVDAAPVAVVSDGATLSLEPAAAALPSWLGWRRIGACLAAAVALVIGVAILGNGVSMPQAADASQVQHPTSSPSARPSGDRTTKAEGRGAAGNGSAPTLAHRVHARSHKNAAKRHGRRRGWSHSRHAAVRARLAAAPAPAGPPGHAHPHLAKPHPHPHGGPEAHPHPPHPDHPHGPGDDG